MPWFKVDDTFPHHAKVLAAGNSAVGLWVRAGAWSMQQLTDGFVPGHVARTLGTPAEAKRLVQAGLWLPVPGGYRFHQWEDRQPSREAVEADRHAARERQRKAREAAKSRRDSRGDSQGTTSVSHGPPDPTRPDPTRSSYGTTEPAVDESPAGPAADKPRAKPKRRLPEDFRPSDDHVALAESLGVDLRAEWPQFCDHWRSKGETRADWPATLRTWIRNAPKFGGNVRALPRLAAPNGAPVVTLASDDKR